MSQNNNSWRGSSHPGQQHRGLGSRRGRESVEQPQETHQQKFERLFPTLDPSMAGLFDFSSPAAASPAENRPSDINSQDSQAIQGDAQTPNHKPPFSEVARPGEHSAPVLNREYPAPTYNPENWQQTTPFGPQRFQPTSPPLPQTPGWGSFGIPDPVPYPQQLEPLIWTLREAAESIGPAAERTLHDIIRVGFGLPSLPQAPHRPSPTSSLFDENFRVRTPGQYGAPTFDNADDSVSPRTLTRRRTGPSRPGLAPEGRDRVPPWRRNAPNPTQEQMSGLPSSSSGSRIRPPNRQAASQPERTISHRQDPLPVVVEPEIAVSGVLPSTQHGESTAALPSKSPETAVHDTEVPQHGDFTASVSRPSQPAPIPATARAQQPGSSATPVRNYARPATSTNAAFEATMAKLDAQIRTLQTREALRPDGPPAPEADSSQPAGDGPPSRLDDLESGELPALGSSKPRPGDLESTNLPASSPTRPGDLESGNFPASDAPRPGDLESVNFPAPGSDRPRAATATNPSRWAVRPDLSPVGTAYDVSPAPRPDPEAEDEAEAELQTASKDSEASKGLH